MCHPTAPHFQSPSWKAKGLVLQPGSIQTSCAQKTLGAQQNSRAPGVLSFQHQHFPPRQAFAAAGLFFLFCFVFGRSCVPQPSLPSACRGLLSCLRHPEGPRRLNTDPEHNRSTKSCRVKFRSIRYCHIHQWRTQRQLSLGTNNASFSSSEVFPPSVKPAAKDKYG